MVTPTTFKNDPFATDASSNERPFAIPKLDFVSETIPDVEGFTEEEVTDMVVLGIGEGLAPNQAHPEVSGTS